MANHSSAKKAIRKTERSTAINKNRKSRIKTYIKKVLEAVNSGSVEEAKKALIVAQSEIMRGAACSLIQKNTAARKVSRLSAKVKNIGLSSQSVSSQSVKNQPMKAQPVKSGNAKKSQQAIDGDKTAQSDEPGK